LSAEEVPSSFAFSFSFVFGLELKYRKGLHSGRNRGLACTVYVRLVAGWHGLRTEYRRPDIDDDDDDDDDELRSIPFLAVIRVVTGRTHVDARIGLEERIAAHRIALY